MSNEITTHNEGGLPDWARKASTGASIGNIDAGDLKPPRLQILAGQSPVIMDATPGARVGNFWLTIHNLDLGGSVTGTPILFKKTFSIWAPRGGQVIGRDPSQKGPLAVATDAIHWDTPNQTFEIQFMGNPKIYKWTIKKTVFETGAHQFGSSNPDDSSSKPIATKTYDALWRIDIGEGKKALCVFTSSRTGLKPTETLMSTINAMGVDLYLQRYRIVSLKKTGPTGDPYFTYDYQSIGLIDEADVETNRMMYQQYSKTGFVVDEGGDEGEPAKPAERDYASRREPMTSKDIDNDEIPF